MQRAIVVKDTGYEDTNLGKKELDGYLVEGWRVVSSCAMPSSICFDGNVVRGEKIPPTCLVIIEKL